ncbi:hypothetical protein MJO28_009629 [Puccinia striiformis f. sp. tritici]|uniref:Uncharacterized protein n=1 Tax=Puccinia striiformis f. sp. tritici TaxID=168172 RepID=A0ACC0E860_9BASI|nr:hypothetical protein Pst134EA_017510 [Puccinia striiformis f. sp. tritici]KAH9461202.1 hypothetical protein Pst134EA_017510 [Puccinia striiformis f. sp. tritici]KAI7947721.1 hypothetical protein MJO28_009629 [Puccinia striiformis f. sp. tritici]KAI7950755.1 hypothetical protein MJO29_009429 [Puccinia striiformis f. sp. tritici]KAI9615294.1 hypothetical protein KEM48_005723 [Puccinia striiformis f. sp. tritici PST-130]
MVAIYTIASLAITTAIVVAHPFNGQLASRQVISSSTSASSSYKSIASQMRTLRQDIAGNRISATEARKQVQSLSQQASTSISAVNTCSTCFTGQQVSSMTASAKETYSEMSSLMQTVGTTYKDQAPSVLQSFGALDSSLKQNLNKFSAVGVPVASIVPTTFAQTVSKAGMSQTAQSASSVQIGGGAIQSTASASSSYKSVASQMRTLRQDIAGNRISASEARKQVQSLSQQASTSISAVNTCSTCFTGQQVSSMTASAKETYSEMSSLMQTVGATYKDQAPSVLQSFGALDSSLKQNLSKFSAVGVPMTNIVPTTFASTVSKAGLSQTSQAASSSVSAGGAKVGSW